MNEDNKIYNRKNLIIGSLTTLPGRINFLQDTLTSILIQSTPLDKLYINIPYITTKGKEYDLKQFLLFIPNLPNNDKIIINRCDKDYGSITKILPTLFKETDPNSLIITFDDDMIYDRNLVEILIDGSFNKNTNSFEKCVGTGGWIVGNFPFLYQSVHDKNREVDWLEGKTAVAYPRKFLPEDPLVLLENPFPAHLSQHDDHIITYHIAKKNAKRFVVDGRKKLEEKFNVRSIDGISSNPIKYLTEVKQIISIMKKENLYNKKVDICETYGFKITMIIVIIFILMVYCYKNKNYI